MKRHIITEGIVCNVDGFPEGSDACLAIYPAGAKRSDEGHRVVVPREMARDAFGQPARVVVEVGEADADDPQTVRSLQEAITRHIAVRGDLIRQRDALDAQLRSLLPIDAKYVLRTDVAAMLEIEAASAEQCAAREPVDSRPRAIYIAGAKDTRSIIAKILNPSESP